MNADCNVSSVLRRMVICSIMNARFSNILVVFHEKDVFGVKYPEKMNEHRSVVTPKLYHIQLNMIHISTCGNGILKL